MMGQNTDPNKKAAGRRAIGGALMMIVLGFLAALLPHVMGASASVSLGWIIVVSGFAYFFYAFAASSDGEVLWRMVIGFFYLFGGFYLLGSRDFDPKSLTFVAAAIVFVESLLELIIFFRLRMRPGAGWILFDGIATLFLACLILRCWPSDSTQTIGILIGVKFIVSGFTRLMYSVALSRERSQLLVTFERDML